VLPRRPDTVDLSAPAACTADVATRPRCWALDVGAQCEVPRHPVCPAVRDPALDVRDTDHLPGEHRAGALALVAGPESPGRAHRRLPCGPVWDAVRMVPNRRLGPDHPRGARLLGLRLPPNGEVIRG